jgi:AraC-like DNA-binding protein
VDHFWLLDEFPAAAKQMIVPDGGLELILNCGGPQRVHDRADTRRFESHRDAWISGLRLAPIAIGTPGPMSIIGVRFKVFGAYRFLPIPLHEIANRVIDATCVLGNSVLALRDRIACAATPTEKFAHFEAFLLERQARPVRAERALADVVRRLSHERCEGRVGALADGLALGPKQLRRLFQANVGISPKSVFRVFRFQRLLAHLETAARPDWAGLANRFGFFDQSHLVKEFRAFTDSGPTEYLSRRGPYLNYLTVS